MMFVPSKCAWSPLLALMLLASCAKADASRPGEWTEARAQEDARVNALIESGRFDAALRIADSLVAAGEDDARVLAQRARSLAGLSREKEAIAAFETSLLKDYESCETHLHFATYLMRMGKTGRAETEFNEAKLFCDTARYPLIYRNLAVAALKQGKRDDALRYADEGLRITPREPYLSGIKGMLIADENPIEAETLFVRSQAAEGKTSDFLVQYGLLLINGGRPAEAIVVLEKALSYEPDNREIKLFLSEALDRAGRSAEAETILNEQLAAWAEPEVRMRLARVLFHERKYEEALSIYHGLDESAEVMDRIAMCNHQLGRSNEALRWARKAVAAAPDWPQGMINLAVILAARGELVEAAKTLERVLGLEPDNVGVRADLERINRALEDVKRRR